jgi:hypothetical protein
MSSIATIRISTRARRSLAGMGTTVTLPPPAEDLRDGGTPAAAVASPPDGGTPAAAVASPVLSEALSLLAVR